VYNQKKSASDWKYWLNVLKKHDRSQVKTAELGGDGKDTSFEQAFSNLAHAYLRDKAPTLLDHEIGFQLLDRNQENTKAVGVFAFKVGSQWIYAPVFFLNGDLKGHELLYIKNQDMFVPLKENWINYIINRKPNILGQGVDRNSGQLGMRYPDFTQLSRSPTKFGSANPSLKEMVTAVIGTFAKCATMKTSAAFEDMGKTLHLPTFLKQAGLDMLSKLVASCQYAPHLAQAIDNFHGLSVIKEAVDLAKQRASQPKIASVLSSAPKVAPNSKTLEIVQYDATVQKALPPGYTEEDQEKLLQDGVLIKDIRDRDNVSIAYDVQTEKKFFNPTESGLYEILVKPGDIERCYVAVYPMGASKRSNFVTVVRTDGKPDWVNTRADHVWALARVEGEEFDKWFDALPAATSVSNNGARHMAISKRGDSTVPFRVLKEYGTDHDTTVYEAHLEDHSKFPPKGDISACCYTDPLNYDKWRDGVRIHLKGKKGSSLRSSMGDIYIPENFKLLKVSRGEDDVENAEDQGACGCGESDPPALQPGSLLDANMILMQKTAALVIRHNGTEVRINDSNPVLEKEALIALVSKHGLREKSAREILSRASKNRKTECRIKYAEPYGPPMMVNQGPNAPTDPGPVMGGETIMNASVPTQMGIDIGMPVADMSASKTDRQIYNPNTALDQKTLKSVVDAANSGQREIFDTAMIGSMLRAVRDDTMVDRYMGDLVKGLDKLGRILFMFYWHGDQFADRYGKADMPELEDSLRNAFEMIGDVILFLKQKTIEPYPEESSQDIDLKNIS
jgi:hypothetical protein